MLSNSPIIVLGMHRSGTSAVAGCLERMGVVMGRNMYGCNEWNAQGYFEDRDVVAFNDQLLEGLGRRWDSLLEADTGNHEAFAEQRASAISLITDIFSGAERWGFKDPRLCKLPGFWTSVCTQMHLQPRLVITLRNPREVAFSLYRRDGISPLRSAWLWMGHLCGALAMAAVFADAVFVDFDRLLCQGDSQLAELANSLKLAPGQDLLVALANDFLSRALLHSPDETFPQMPAWVEEVFAALRKAIAAGESPGHFSRSPLWAELRKQFAEREQSTLGPFAEFLAEERQVEVLERRIVQLTNALAVVDDLATARLAEIHVLDNRLAATTEALRCAEDLSRNYLAEAQTLDGELANARKALPEAQKFAEARLVENRRLDEQLKSVNIALATAERLAKERLAVIDRLDAQIRNTQRALASAESLVNERQTSLLDLEKQLQQTTCALALAERLALDRARQIELLEGEIVSCRERLAVTQGEVEVISRRLHDLESSRVVRLCRRVGMLQ